jgi:DNA-binding HxlR family transcriptional regulator
MQMPRSSGPFDVFNTQCPSRRLLDLIADKWTVLVLHALAGGTMRHHQLLHRIDGISQKMLIQTLRHLERNGLAERYLYAEVPPRVEYTLTPLGASLEQTVGTLCEWAVTHLHEVEDAQDRYDEVHADVCHTPLRVPRRSQRAPAKRLNFPHSD